MTNSVAKLPIYNFHEIDMTRVMINSTGMLWFLVASNYTVLLCSKDHVLHIYRNDIDVIRSGMKRSNSDYLTLHRNCFKKTIIDFRMMHFFFLILYFTLFTLFNMKSLKFYISFNRHLLFLLLLLANSNKCLLIDRSVLFPLYECSNLET